MANVALLVLALTTILCWGGMGGTGKARWSPSVSRARAPRLPRLPGAGPVLCQRPGSRPLCQRSSSSHLHRFCVNQRRPSWPRWVSLCRKDTGCSRGGRVAAGGAGAAQSGATAGPRPRCLPALRRGEPQGAGPGSRYHVVLCCAVPRCSCAAFAPGGLIGESHGDTTARLSPKRPRSPHFVLAPTQARRSHFWHREPGVSPTRGPAEPVG